MSLAVGVTVALLPAEASAQAIAVDDGADADSTAAYLDIDRVSFSNSRSAVRVDARHPGLMPSAITGVYVFIDVPKWNFMVSAAPGEAPLLYRSRDGVDGDAPPVNCPRLRTTFEGANPGAGKVRVRIPQSCLTRTKYVRMAYQIGNWHRSDYDFAPNLTSDGNIRWTRRLHRS